MVFLWNYVCRCELFSIQAISNIWVCWVQRCSLNMQFAGLITTIISLLYMNRAFWQSSLIRFLTVWLLFQSLWQQFRMVLSWIYSIQTVFLWNALKWRTALVHIQWLTMFVNGNRNSQWHVSMYQQQFEYKYNQMVYLDVALQCHFLAFIREQNIDFEVNFNPQININSPIYAPITQAQVDSIVCNISTHRF